MLMLLMMMMHGGGGGGGDGNDYRDNGDYLASVCLLSCRGFTVLTPFH